MLVMQGVIIHLNPLLPLPLFTLYLFKEGQIAIRKCSIKNDGNNLVFQYIFLDYEHVFSTLFREVKKISLMCHKMSVNI